MNDIETLVRDGLRYEGDLVGLASDGLIRRARKRRVTQLVGAGTVVGALGLAAFAAWASWAQPGVGIDVAGPDDNPSASDHAPAITLLKAHDRFTSADGAVIIVTPEKLCVGNTQEKPSCLIGADPSLAGDQAILAFYTQSPDDFVYAWLVPEDSTQASLQVGDSLPRQGSLFRVQGRKLMIAVVTGGTCWGPDTRYVQLATDSEDRVTYKRDITGDATCP